MNKGTIVQFDTPKNIVTNPANVFVKSLIGLAIDKENFWRDLND